mgnify:CR=1 FL=1
MSASLDKLIDELNRRYSPEGKPKIGIASEVVKPRERIPTGCFRLDAALEGGIPMGVVTEIAGSPGAGKTTLALHVIGRAQRLHPETYQVYISAEGPLSPDSFTLAGVDPSRVVVFEPFEYAEKAMNALKDILRGLSGGIDVIVLDSVAALAPYMEIESVEKGGIEGQTVGILARVMDKFYRVFVGTGLFSESAVIAVNQFRQQVSAVPLPPTVKGGESSKYYPKLRLWLTTSPSKKIKLGDAGGMETLPGMPDFSMLSKTDPIGHEVEAQIIKDNLRTRPMEEKISYRVIYGYGYDNFQPVVHYGEKIGVVVRKGAYYQYGDIKSQGLYQFITDCIHAGVWDELVRTVMGRVMKS